MRPLLRLFVNKQLMNCKQKIPFVQPSSKFSCSVMKYDAGLGDSYQGSGKTTMNDLSDEDPRILVAGFNQYGFLLNSGQRALGPILVLPDAIFQWNIATPLHAKPESFALVEILHPKPQCVIFGYGSATQVESRKVEKTNLRKEFEKERNKMITNVVMHMRKLRIQCECMPTEHAIGVYNFMVSEDRLVMGALIPPDTVGYLNENEKISNILSDQMGGESGNQTTDLYFDDDLYKSPLSLPPKQKEFLETHQKVEERWTRGGGDGNTDPNIKNKYK